MDDAGLIAFRAWRRRLVSNGHSARHSRVAEDAFRAGYAARGDAIEAAVAPTDGAPDRSPKVRQSPSPKLRSTE